MGTRESAFWFGPRSRPLFGWTHVPENRRVRAAVVICPSLGLEAGFSYFALRRVAEQLADIGILVCRFDYDGTGDSAGQTDDPARVAAWQTSIGTAIELVRSMTDRPIALLGMRLGALLAASRARGSDDIDGLVLWDPPRSGRAYLREQRARHVVSLGDNVATDSSTVCFLGTDYSAETAAALSELALGTLAELPVRRCLVLERPGQSALARQVDAAKSSALVVHTADGQDDMLLRQVTPEETIGRVVSWFAESYAASDYGEVREPSTYDATAAVGYGSTAVTEHLVRLGPHNLFGIVSEPEPPAVGPTIVFVPDSHTPHVGLSRMWVDLARQWAEAGLRVLRFDLSGNGDSAPWPGLPPHQTRSVAHLDDVRHVAKAVSASDPSDVVFVGICSGAYECLEAALTCQPRGIAVINPSFSFIPTERPVSRRRQARQATRRVLSVPFGRVVGRIARRLSPVLKDDEGFEWDYWFESCHWQGAISRRTSNVPAFAWTILNRLLLDQQPAEILARIADAGTDVYVLFGDPENDDFSQGARRLVDRLEAKPNFQREHLAKLDHSVLGAGQRARTMAALTRAVVTRWAGEQAPSRVDALSTPSGS